MNAATTTTHHRVLMTDVDLVQVNYTRMFVWMDHGFTQLLHDLEHPSSTLLRQGWSTPVVDAHCSYVRPVTLDDEFNVWIRNHPQHAAMRVPEWLRQALVPRESAPTSNGKAKSTGESSPGMPQLSLSPNVTQVSTSHD